MASLVVLECDVDNGSGGGQPSPVNHKLQMLKFRQQETRRLAKARFGPQSTSEPVFNPVELSASSMPLNDRVSDTNIDTAGPRPLPEETLIGTKVYMSPFEEASTRATATSTDSRPTTSSSARSITNSRPVTQGSSRPGTGASRGSRLSNGERAGSTFSMGSLASQDLVEYQDLGPFMDPSAVLQTVLRVLSAANVAKRLELDWQAQNEAITDARRLVQHHASIVEPYLHALVLALLPAVDALRSQTCKDALSLFQELIQTFGRALDPEVEAMVPALAKKAGEMSTAGRETFLAMEASTTLSSLVDLLSVGRVAAALIACAGHKAPSVRYKVAMHLDACVQGSNGQRLSGSQGMLGRVFKAASDLLDEGREDTRAYAKRTIWALGQLAAVAEPGGVDRLIKQLPNEEKKKKLKEIASSGAGLPPPPNKYTPGRTR